MRTGRPEDVDETARREAEKADQRERDRVRETTSGTSHGWWGVFVGLAEPNLRSPYGDEMKGWQCDATGALFHYPAREIAEAHATEWNEKRDGTIGRYLRAEGRRFGGELETESSAAKSDSTIEIVCGFAAEADLANEIRAAHAEGWTVIVEPVGRGFKVLLERVKK